MKRATLELDIAMDALRSVAHFLIVTWLMGEQEEEDIEFIITSLKRCRAFSDFQEAEFASALDGARLVCIEASKHQNRINEIGEEHASILSELGITQTAFAICLEYMIWCDGVDDVRAELLNQICEGANLDTREMVLEYTPSIRALIHNFD